MPLRFREGDGDCKCRVRHRGRGHPGCACAGGPEQPHWLCDAGVPGYTGPASDQCRLIKVKAVTHRRSPIMQTCIGPSEEHVSMAGIPTEASIYSMVEKAMPGRLQNVYCGSAGGGKYMAVLQFKKLKSQRRGKTASGSIAGIFGVQ